MTKGNEVINVSHFRRVLSKYKFDSLPVKYIGTLDKETSEVLDYFICSFLHEVVEISSVETSEHMKRVGKLSSYLAQALDMGDHFSKSIEIAAPLHDIGKLGIPDYIIDKPGPLDKEERSLMERHPLIGHRLLQNDDLPIMKMAADIAAFHHERWDGQGYPYGLKGSEIPESARIVSICDTFDALTSNRAYKKKWSIDKAKEYLRSQSGKKYDPDFTGIFLEKVIWD